MTVATQPPRKKGSPAAKKGTPPATTPTPPAEDHDCDCGCGARTPCTPRIDALINDDLVDGINPECGDGAGLAPYQGFLQKVPGCSGQCRLYLTLELDDYLLLCDEDIVAQRQRGDGSIVWVRRDRPIKRVRVQTPDQQRMDYLQGEIGDLWGSAPQGVPARGWGAAPAAAGGVIGGVPWPMTIPPCPASQYYTQCKPCR